MQSRTSTPRRHRRQHTHRGERREADTREDRKCEMYALLTRPAAAFPWQPPQHQLITIDSESLWLPTWISTVVDYWLQLLPVASVHIGCGGNKINVAPVLMSALWCNGETAPHYSIIYFSSGLAFKSNSPTVSVLINPLPDGFKSFELPPVSKANGGVCRKRMRKSLWSLEE